MKEPKKINYRNLEEFRKLMGPEGDDLSEGQLRILKKEVFELADIILDLVLQRCLEAKDDKQTELDL